MAFLEMLNGRSVLRERDEATPDSFFGQLRPLEWFRRTFSGSFDRHA